MKDKITQIKEGVCLHTIKTDIFKTNLVAVFITLKLNRENVTKNALIPAVLRRGTKNIPTQEEISKLLESMYGASFDCGIEKTGDNHVIKFYLESLNDKFIPQSENLIKTSIETLLEIIFNPYTEQGNFKPEYIESEKNNIRQLIDGKIDSKDFYAMTRCTEEMFKGSPYSLFKYGYIEDLEKITPEELYNYYIKMLETCKIDIFVSGSFEENEILNIVKENENVKKLKSRTPEFSINNEKTEIKEQKEIKKTEEKMDIAQGKLVIGLDILEDKEDSRFVATVYNTILGDSANSKLFQNVREKAHLAYTARSSYIKPKHCIFIRAGIEIENYEKAVKIIEEQLEDMKNGNFTDEDIKDAKNYLLSAIDAIPEEQDTEITYYLGQELSGASYTPEEYKQKIEAVSKEQIQEIAQKVKIDTIFFLRN